MIYDQISNLGAYAKLAPEAMAKLEAFFKSVNKDTPNGRFELMGDDLFAMIQRYNTHEANPDKLEIHRNYIDLQMLLDGVEVIHYAPAAALPVTVPYNPEKDCGFHHAVPLGLTPVRLTPGNFAIFLPEEGHMPGCGDPSQSVVKVVVKIRRSLFGL